MPSSLADSYPGGGALRAYLQTIMPDARLTGADVNSAYQPLLLLETKYLLAAFAFSNGELRTSYDALYGGFKNYCANQRGRADALDIAFVFCAQPGPADLYHFCSTVETDVYFCRKFVITLTPPLETSLARLPFLPLTPMHGKSLRPPSAQTYLQQCGVPALLAKFLVVQHERGPERIVEDCVKGRFGEPQDLRSASNAPVLQPDATTKSVRLETVTIKNFRAYRKPQTFEVGADVTVLYGPNGFGKTSFFDAIDFAVTGGIARFETANEAHFAKTVQHLDSLSEESVVTLSFRCNGAERKVVRSVSDRKQALLDGCTTSRKAILAELIGSDILSSDRVENSVSLFRATHLCSQERQELTKDFGDDCRLPAQIVSRMLAFEDYANAQNKAAKVHEVLRTAIANATTEIKELSEQLTGDKGELEQLGQTAKANTNVEALDAEFDALRARLVEVGLVVAPQKPDAATVRSWRATLEARHAESQSRTDRLSSLAQETARLPRMRTELANLRQQLAQKEQTLGTTEEKRLAAELALQRAEQHLAEMKTQGAEEQARSALFEWARKSRPVYAQLIEKQRTLNAELKRATDSLAANRAAEEKAVDDLRAQENRATEAAEKLGRKRVEAQAQSVLLEWARNTKPLYSQLVDKQRTIGDELRRATDTLAQHRTAEESAVNGLHVQENRAAEAAQKLQTKRTEFAAVQSLNESTTLWHSNCARLAAAVETEKAAANSLESMRGEERELSPQVASVSAEEARLSRQLAEADGNQTELKNLLSQLQGHVRTGICPLCGEDHGSKEELLRRIQHHVAIDAASSARADLTGMRERAKLLAERVAANRQKQQGVEAQLKALKNERARLEEEQNQFTNSAAKLGVVIEMSGPTPTEQLQARSKRLQQEIGELNRQIQETQIAADAARTVVANTKSLVAASAADVTRLQTILAPLEAEINQLRNDPRFVQISSDLDAEQLAGAESARLQQEIGELNRQIKKTQIEADAARTAVTNTKSLAAATAAEVTHLQTTLVRLEAELSQLRNDPRLTQISLDGDQEQLAETERLNQDKLTHYKVEASKVETEVAQQKLMVNALRQESATLKAQLSALRTQLTNLQKTVTQIAARLLESKLPEDANEQMLLALISDESRLQAQFLALRDSTSNFELAIDAATTAAALTRLLQIVRTKEKAVAAAVQKRSQHQPWQEYFAELSRLVSAQQNEAIANFTSEYGPRTSIIQRRLRSVYGFDEIEIQSHESSISVRVKRHGESLRPTDYFSQSQQQTLFLGLFLTACISQTWSGFSPVFLDDPVTHFDDLNTYAFLDLIVGLLDSDFGKRQFIISTCDEKLFQLARQKFRHLGDHATFYRFEAIAPEGPSVSRVTV